MTWCVLCGAKASDRYCGKCQRRQDEIKQKCSLPGGHEQKQDDGPISSLDVSREVRELFEEQDRKARKDANVLSGRKSLNTIDADSDAFGRATD